MPEFLTKAQILAAPDLPRETVDTPEWGGQVCVKTLNGIERNAMIEGYVEADKVNPGEPFDIHLVGATLCDESGVPQFNSISDIRLLAQRNGAALDRVYRVAQRLNGFSRSAEKKG